MVMNEIFHSFVTILLSKSIITWVNERLYRFLLSSAEIYFRRKVFICLFAFVIPHMDN
jgi:hypothetical protein